MITATPSRKLRTFSGGAYVADLMAEINRREITMRVQQARKEIGLRQEDVADLMNVTTRAYQYWESQSHPIVVMDRLDELAGVLKTSKFWLLHGQDLPGSAEDAATLAEIVRRLSALEATVQDQGELTAKSVDALARDLRALTRRLGREDGPTSRRATGS